MNIGWDVAVSEELEGGVGGHGPASGRGEHQSGAGACELGGVFEYSYYRFGEGHVVAAVVFDIAGWDSPDAVFEVDLVPGGFEGFAAADAGEG